MEKPEIVAGIQNAIARGSSMDSAIQSFVNAGYNLRDVEDSARALGASIPNERLMTPKTQATNESSQQVQNTSQSTARPSFPSTPPQSSPQPIQSQPKPAPILPPTNSYAPQQTQVIQQPKPQPFSSVSYNPPKKKGVGLIILLVIVLILLLCALGAVLFAKDAVIEFLKTIGLDF